MMTENTTDKSKLITSNQMVERDRPLTKPFVGKLVKWEIRPQDFTQADGSVRHTDFLRLYWDPQNAAAPWESGLYFSEWPMSSEPDTVYGCMIAAFDAAIAAASGIPGKKFTDPDEIIAAGWLFQLEEVEPTNAFWDRKFQSTKGSTKGQMVAHIRENRRANMTKRYLVVTGPAPEGWEATVPQGLAELKLQAMQKASARKAEREADKGASSSSGVSVIQSFTEATKVDIEGLEVYILDFLDGKNEADNLVLAAMQDEALAEALGDRHQDVVFGLGSKKVQGDLVARNMLTVSQDGTYSR